MPRVALNAHLLSRDQSYRGAGVSHYIDSLLRHLPSADDRLDYTAYLGSTELDYAGWTCRAAPWSTGSPLRRILWEQSLQPCACYRQKVDLLHAPVNVGPLIRSCPLVVTIHDLSFLLYPQLFRSYNRQYLSAMARYTVHHAERVIAVSANTRDDLVRLLGVAPDKVIVIPNGVDQEMRVLPIEDVRAFRARAGLPEKFILYLGTLEPRKNLPVLIAAFADLGRDLCEYSLVIAGGKGWYYEEIDRLVDRLGLAEKVVFPGFVPQQDLPLWYNAAALFVYPSLYEGFGLPPLEAMACGTPVIASNASSLPEVVGDAGVLTDPQDVPGLTQAMTSILANPIRHQQLREAGLRRASLFSWQTTAIQTTQLYRQILGG